MALYTFQVLTFIDIYVEVESCIQLFNYQRICHPLCEHDGVISHESEVLSVVEYLNSTFNFDTSHILVLRGDDSVRQMAQHALIVDVAGTTNDSQRIRSSLEEKSLL